MFGRYAFSAASIAGQAPVIYVLELTENIELLASPSIAGGFAVAIDENATLNNTDAETDVFYFGNVDAVFSVDATINANAGFVIAQTDNIGLEDTLSITAQFAGSISEAFTALDILSSGSTFFFGIDEILIPTDARSISADFSLTPIENVNISDARGVIAHFSINRNEAFALTEHLEQHGWIKIPDTQNANWQAINDAQTAGWTSINDAQTPGWTPIQDEQ